MKAILPILILGALLTGCSTEPKETAAESAPVAVTTITLAQADWPAVYEASGTVRARTAAVISSKVMGYVREVGVRTGDRVAAGQTLVVLDSRDLEAGYRQAEAALNEARSGLPEAENGVAAAKANLDLAKVTYGRMKDLFEKKSISNQEYDEAGARLKVAQANYEMAVARRTQLHSKIAQAEQGFESAKVMRSYAELTAPFAGTVTEKTVDPGNLAAPGAPLLTLEREGDYRLEVAVEESRLAALRAGQPVTVSLDALDRTIEGRVSEIVPAVDAASRAFTVKIDLPSSPHLRSGLYGRAKFTFGHRPVLAVPAEACDTRGQLISVLVADGGLAHARLVTLGEKQGDRVEVLSGLSAGDKVVFPVPAGVSDGSRVEVRP
jgi:multidrug efflux system membrane fusion protein